MARREYSEETRAAVMAALLEGQSISSIAKRYKIPRGTVSGWKSKAERVADVPTQKKAEIGDKLIELLQANLDALIAISKQFQDTVWLKEQGAAELATAYGIKHDKLIRVLDALDNDNSAND